jgi:3-dehydroquinate synthase
MSRFRIQDHDFSYTPVVANHQLPIASVPRPYVLDFASHTPLIEAVRATIATSAHPLLLIDVRVRDLYFKGQNLVPADQMLCVDATEGFKTLDGALQVCDLMQRCGASRTSTLYVIGGGILQDVGGFAAAMYKRGIPWVFIPTTVLAQSDSCVGGKTGLNHQSTKNLLALFSAPRRVLIHTGFLATLSDADLISGMGEVLRLAITGGPDSVALYERLSPHALARDGAALETLIAMAASVKRQVVEADEFELDLRRSMNYGHSIGHALEVMVNHAIPHGTAVAIGMAIENDIALAAGIMNAADRDRLAPLCAALIPAEASAHLADLRFDTLLDLLARDKKTEGCVLKLAVIERIGQMRLIDFPLIPESLAPVERAFAGLAG